jgi:hypothetical protein
MKKIAFTLVILFAMFAIIGCGDGGGGGGNETSPARMFWAQNAVTERFYQLEAEKLAENSRCEVWVEKGSGVTVSVAVNIANEYSNNIYAKMINTFGWNENVQLQNQVKNMNTMEIAHWLATGETNNAKLTILLLDIKDGYQPGVNESYVAGYFWPYDILSSLLPDGYKSNKLDMIYIDTNPGLKNSENISEAYMTLAHEMQHLMNLVSSYAYRIKNNTLYSMDIWIDEGLSAAAEWVYSGIYSDDRVGWFCFNGNGRDMNGKIDVGNNFYVWGNRENESIYANLDDYATVYLFFQWLRLQSNSSIYKEIIMSDKYDYQAVISAFNNKKASGSNYSDWGPMLKDWLAANSTNSAAGRDGYKNDSTLKNITASYAPTGTTDLGLYPGEGVYSYSGTPPSFSPSGNIKYEYFSGNNTLLTYNGNAKNYDENIASLIESGTTTGVKPSIRMPGNYDIKLGFSKISGPFRIGMGDVIRMNKNSNRINFDMTKFERVFIDE